MTSHSKECYILQEILRRYASQN